MTPLQIQRFYAKLQLDGSNRNYRDRGLGAKAIKNIHGILHRALSQAVRWELLVKNPADSVDLPKQTRAKINSATPEELRRLMSAIDDTGVWRLPILIAIATGMRRGEVLGLQWQDFLPEKSTIIVQRALSQLSDDNVIVKGTKTDRVRVVLINPSLVEELNRHRTASRYNKPTDWVCAGPDGNHLVPRKLTRYFEGLVDRLGIDITLHGLHHSHATALIAAGVPVKAVSERLGHSTIVITQDTYAHVLPTMQIQAAETMEKIWKMKGNATDGDTSSDEG